MEYLDSSRVIFAEISITSSRSNQNLEKYPFLENVFRCSFKFFDVPAGARQARKGQRDVGDGAKEGFSGEEGTINDGFDWDE